LTVEFSVEDDLEGKWDEARTALLVRSIVSRELGANWVISLHLVSDATIRALNAAHRHRDAATDVLSFPLDSACDADFAVPPGQPVQLGDVVVSLPRAVEQAHEYGHSVDREIAYLVAHGVLHLLGYDHEVQSEKETMRAREEEALEPLGFTR